MIIDLHQIEFEEEVTIYEHVNTNTGYLVQLLRHDSELDSAMAEKLAMSFGVRVSRIGDPVSSSAYFDSFIEAKEYLTFMIKNVEAQQDISKLSFNRDEIRKELSEHIEREGIENPELNDSTVWVASANMIASYREFLHMLSR